MTQKHVPTIHFSTLDLPPPPPRAAQFAAYRRAMSAADDVAPPDAETPATFAATIAMWQLGPLKLGTEQLDPHWLRRPAWRAGWTGSITIPSSCCAAAWWSGTSATALPPSAPAGRSSMTQPSRCTAAR